MPNTSRNSVNRKMSLNTSLDSECLDLSLKEVFVIMYFPDSDPGKEYEILSEKELVNSWVTLKKGVRVFCKFGNAKVQGVIVAVSDDFSYLTSHFAAITEEHSEEVQRKKVDMKVESQTNRSYFIERHMIKVTDTATQTENFDDFYEQAYDEMKRKYDELKTEYNDMSKTISDIQSNMELNLEKIKNIKKLDDSSSYVSSPSSSRATSPRMKKVLKSKENTSEGEVSFNQMVQIGSKGTEIPKTVYDSVNWTSYTTATRKLLITLFPREVLATHSLTGKRSPAFLTSDKQAKVRLDPAITADIVEIISRKCKVSESLVRCAITTKCADENKLYRKRLEKRRGSDNENDPCSSTIKRPKNYRH